jgi:hypothetical protein
MNQRKTEVRFAFAAVCLLVATNASAEAKPKPKPVVAKPAPADAKPDCSALEVEAKVLFAEANYAASLTRAEATAKCTGNNSMATIAAIAACRSKNAERARFWAAHLKGSKLLGVIQACSSVNIELVAPPATAPAKSK